MLNYPTPIVYSLMGLKNDSCDISTLDNNYFKEENVTVFTQSELVDKTDYVLYFINRITKSCVNPNCGSLKSRLIELNNEVKEDEPGSDGIVTSSLYSFFRFMDSDIRIERPSIGISPDNNIFASWRVKKYQVFNVHFLSDMTVRYVILESEHQEPQSGTAYIDSLIEIVNSTVVKDWIIIE